MFVFKKNSFLLQEYIFNVFESCQCNDVMKLNIDLPNQNGFNGMLFVLVFSPPLTNSLFCNVRFLERHISRYRSPLILGYGLYVCV